MLKLLFRIEGNQDDPNGNPVPFQRAIKGMWRKASQRYMEWQSHVRIEFYKSSDGDGIEGLKKAMTNPGGLKPINLEPKQWAEMHIDIWWKNNAHGDADNVFKGILDALFVNDKEVWKGSYDSHIAPDKKGMVSVRIIIHNK